MLGMDKAYSRRADSRCWPSHPASRGPPHVSHENACQVMNQLGCGGRAKTEDCDLAYSIEETPFKRDTVREIRKAARHAGSRLRSTSLIRIGRTQTFGPAVTTSAQVPSSPKRIDLEDAKRRLGNNYI